MKNHLLLKLPVLTILAASTAPLLAAPGSLDPSFNGTGIVIRDFAGTEDLRAVAVLPDGKIIAAGTTDASGHDDILVVRYNPNGTVDTSFSADGTEITSLLPTSNETVKAMAVQPDGKIVVVGHTDANGTGVNLDMFAVRFNANGGLDTTFGIGGTGKYTINPSPSADDEASGVAILPDGKIMIGGSARTNTSTVFSLARLGTNGILDATFSGDGYQEITAAGFAQCNAIRLQPNGKIVMVGQSKAAGNQDFIVACCNADGTLDTTFSNDGLVQTNLIGQDIALAVAVQPDGKILVAGTAASGADSVAIRYNSDGTLDTSFASAGIFRNAFGSFSFFGSVVLQADGKILLGGASGTLAGRNFTVVRLSPSGILDTSFDGDGYVISNINPAGGNFIWGMALQPDGRLVAVGQSGNSSRNIALARYNMFQKADSLVGNNLSTFFGDNIYNGNGAGQAITITTKKTGKKRSGFVKIQNDGHESDSFTIAGAKGNKRFKVKYLNGTTDVTKLVTAGTFNTGTIAPGASLSLKVEVTTQKKSEGKSRNLLVTATSGADSSSADAILITAKNIAKK